MGDITIHPAAEAEYEQALEWYLNRSPQAAERFEAAYDEAIEAILSNPTLFPLCDDLHRFVSLKRYPFTLIYRWDGHAARVIAVAHAKRRPGPWSDRD